MTSYIFSKHTIRITALEKVDLRNLITKPKDSTIQKQNDIEPSLFDDI